jgi:hypothetical protein
VSKVLVAYTSLLPTIVHVTISVSFPVIRSALLHVILIELAKLLHQVPEIVPVITIAPVAHHASELITKLLGLAVVKLVG